jgi:protein-arginine deiminase
MLARKSGKKALIFLTAVAAVFLARSLLSDQDSVSPTKLKIAADVNRDGKVEFETDELGKNLWTRERGAIFFNNNDSDQDSKEPDHADKVINGDKDLEDLAILKIKQIPNFSQSSRISISVDDSSISRVNLFQKVADNRYQIIDLTADGNIDRSRLMDDDIEFRIEANSYADALWSGIVEVTVSARTPDGKTQLDSVKLKVAPFILLSNLNKGLTLYVREIPRRNAAFLKSLGELVPRAGAELIVIPEGEPYPPSNIWLQDTLEIGYSEMPGRRMNVALIANRNRPLDNYARDSLLGPDFGWVQVGIYRDGYGGGKGLNRWLDWYGNLEVTPPLPGYPFGRIYYGYNPEGPKEASLNPEIVAMLEAQGIQSPALRLDTGWLVIKHVDEIVSFLPSGDPAHSYKVLVVDTSAMFALLEKWKSEGLGESPMLGHSSKETTVSSLLENKTLMDLNKTLQIERIEPNISLLKRELGLREEDFIRVPSFFDRYGGALVPNMVNSAVLNGHIFIVAPDGPVIEGQDLLEQEMRMLISGLPLTPHFLDAHIYHRWGGEVHCATNVRREGFSAAWWEIR